jgi:hypothetical protein
LLIYVLILVVVLVGFVVLLSDSFLVLPEDSAGESSKNQVDKSLKIAPSYFHKRKVSSNSSRWAEDSNAIT